MVKLLLFILTLITLAAFALVVKWIFTYEYCEV